LLKIKSGVQINILIRHQIQSRYSSVILSSTRGYNKTLTL
jgi:hypothetical protein